MDLSDIEKQLVQTVAGVLLTTGPYTPYSVATSDVLNAQFRLMRGWPVDNQLDNDLLAGITNVTVFMMPGTRDTTRFLRQNTPTVTNVPTPTMTATLVNNQVTFAGTGFAKEVIGISVGNTDGFSVRLTDSDTPTTMAAAFAAGLQNATASGPVLTINSIDPIKVAIGCDVTVLTEVHRQEQMWKVSIWAPTTDLRDQFCSVIDPGLQWIDRYFMADGSVTGPVIGAGTFVDDVPEKEHLWRRDLHYCVEYPTEYTQIVPVMVLGELAQTDGAWRFFEA